MCCGAIHLFRVAPEEKFFTSMVREGFDAALVQYCDGAMLENIRTVQH